MVGSTANLQNILPSAKSFGFPVAAFQVAPLSVVLITPIE